MNFREAIEEQGFAMIHSVFSDARMTELSRAIGTTTPKRSRAGVRHAMALSPVADLAHDLLEIARPILGRGTFPFRATLFDKSPGSNWLVVWHQDTAIPLKQHRELPGWGPWSTKGGVVYAHAPSTCLAKVLALRVHLDDSASENGPLRVLPGTHNGGVLTDDEIHELAGRIMPVECTIGRGGVVAMRPLIVHASSKSRVERSRRVLHIEYATSLEIASPHELAIA